MQEIIFFLLILHLKNKEELYQRVSKNRSPHKVTGVIEALLKVAKVQDRAKLM